MTWWKVCGFGACLALGACGRDERAVLESVDVSLGLDERPPNPDCLGSETFPELLSEHPCFEGEPPLVKPALIPYGVIAPLWSDGADKMRYLAVPDESALVVAKDGEVLLPPGGVLVKEFATRATRLETRLLTRDFSGEWHAATYVWNEKQSDAVLEKDGADIALGNERWLVPTEAECFDCHTEAAGTSLGLEQRQLARSLEYTPSGRTADQIHTLQGLGLLEGESDDQPLIAPDDESGDLELRARAYLHSNCSHCHRPGGLGEGELDLRASTPFYLTRTCNELPDQGDPNGEGGYVLEPGDPERSALYLRMASQDPSWRMPPVGSEVVDITGSDLIARWIASLEDCPE